MNHQFTVCAEAGRSTLTLSVDLPDGWARCNGSNAEMHLESPDGTKACYLYLRAVDTPIDLMEALNAARTSESATLAQMAGRAWDCLADEVVSSPTQVVSIRDNLDREGLYRIVDKLIVTDRAIARGAFHDYYCEDYQESKAYFARLIESLRLVDGSGA